MIGMTRRFLVGHGLPGGTVAFLVGLMVAGYDDARAGAVGAGAAAGDGPRCAATAAAAARARATARLPTSPSG